MTLLNQGLKPFEMPVETGARIGKKEASKRNRTYYKEVGLKSHLRKACPICHRKMACNHRSFGNNNEFVPNKPVLLITYRECTSCNASIDSTCTICPSCHFYDPFKERVKNKEQK